MDSVRNLITGPHPIRLGDPSTDLGQACQDQIPSLSVSANSNQSFSRQPPAQADHSEIPTLAEVHMDGDHRPQQIEILLGDLNLRAFTATPEASRTSGNFVVPPIRTPSMSFKARQLRGKFDADALEKHFDIELSPEASQRLRALSGNDLATTVNLDLQGRCQGIENERPEAYTGVDEPCSRFKSPPNTDVSLSSIEFWQQLRQSQRQQHGPHPKKAKVDFGRRFILLEDQSTTRQPSDQGYAEPSRKLFDHRLNRTDRSALAQESPSALHSATPLITRQTSSREIVAGMRIGTATPETTA